MTSPPTKHASQDRTGSDDGLSIAEVAERTGLSQDTLRYYEKAGLIEPVDRSPGGQRRYATDDLDWLTFLLRLRATGMPIATMQHFAELRRAGNTSVSDRLDLLTAHRDAVERHISVLREHLQALDAKLTYYQNLLDEQAGTEQS